MADEVQQPPEEKYGNKLPQQVRDQMAQVEAMMSPPKEEDTNQDQETEDQVDDESEQDSDDPAQAPQPAGAAANTSPAGEESWEQRARSAAGRLEQALTANQQMSRQLADLQQQMNTLKIRGAEAPDRPPAAPKPKPQLIKPEELNDYGEEFFDVVGRRAKEEIAPAMETFEERIKRLESGQQAVGQVVERTQKRGLYDTLYEEVPDWKMLNHTPEFHNWLAFPDPYSGRQRHEMLQEAFSRHDASRVVAFFRGFLTEAASLPSNGSSNARPAAPPLANGNGSGRPSLEDFAAPGRARSAPQTLPPDKPVYSSAWIAKFMADKRTGKYRGREAEAEAIERDFYQAQHEGRLQP